MTKSEIAYAAAQKKIFDDLDWADPAQQRSVGRRSPEGLMTGRVSDLLRQGFSFKTVTATAYPSRWTCEASTSRTVQRQNGFLLDGFIQLRCAVR
jgi:hypothetical protein